MFESNPYSSVMAEMVHELYTALEKSRRPKSPVESPTETGAGQTPQPATLYRRVAAALWQREPTLKTHRAEDCPR